MTETLSESKLSENSITAACREVAGNWRANLRALRQTQPRLAEAVQFVPPSLEWVYGRDGSLTGLEENGQWWAGCSVPRRAAEFMLRNAVTPGGVVCFLAPTHAAQLRVALDRLEAGQAVLAIVPELLTLRIALSCENFSRDLAAHRLYFASGHAWEIQLNQLLEENPGLPTPTQFIRPILSDYSVVDLLVPPAQKVFAEQSARRLSRIHEVRGSWKNTRLNKICVVAPSRFRLWDDTGAALSRVLGESDSLSSVRGREGTRESASSLKGEITAGVSALRFDPDDPASASPLALAAAAARCNALVTPNLGRADFPDLIPDAMPWATWLTVPRIPSFVKSGPRDSLIVADPAWKTIAIERGWPADRVFVATWPCMQTAIDSDKSVTSAGVFHVSSNPHLAIISDTKPLDPPERVEEYSSHRLLWDSIGHELLAHPFALKQDANAYLSERMRQARLDGEAFDRDVFLNGIVLHAYQQGIARLVVREGIPLKLCGNGWDKLDDLSPRSEGPVQSREQLSRAVQSAAALVHVWPTFHVHPMDATGKLIVRPGLNREDFISTARLAISARPLCPSSSTPTLKTETILTALGGSRSMVGSGLGGRGWGGGASLKPHASS